MGLIRTLQTDKLARGIRGGGFQSDVDQWFKYIASLTPAKSLGSGSQTRVTQTVATQTKGEGKRRDLSPRSGNKCRTRKSRTSDKLKGGIISQEEAIKALVKEGISQKDAEFYINEVQKPQGWNTTAKEGIKSMYDEWRRMTTPQREETTKKRKKSQPKPIVHSQVSPTPPVTHLAPQSGPKSSISSLAPAAPAAPSAPSAPSVPAAPAAPAAPAVRVPVGPKFSLNSKTFDDIKNTKPKLEFKRLLKNYFDELAITSYSKLPGDFVKAINDAHIRTAGGDERLKGVLDFYKITLSKREEPAEKVIKLKVVKAPPKKATRSGVTRSGTKKVKKAKPVIAAVKRARVVKAIPKAPSKRKMRPSKKSKKGGEA